MRRLALAAALALVGCGMTPPAQVPVSGAVTVAVDRPRLLGPHPLPSVPRESLSLTGRSGAGASTGAARPSTSGDVEQWRALVAQYPWPVDQALRIMECESNGNPNAKNPRSSACGLFQIMWSIWADTYFDVTGSRDPFDPAANIAFAYWLWSRSGWQPWVCRKVLT